MSDVPHSPEPTACVPQLLEAMRAVGSGLGPHATLERICATATALVDAGRVAIGVLAENGTGFADFVHHGVDEETVRWVEPIRVHGEVLGNLYLTGKRGGGPFTEHDLTLVRVLATEAGIAIGNARLYEAARQREHWIDGSVAVTTALLSGGDIGDSLRIVAEQARRLLRGRRRDRAAARRRGRPGDRRRERGTGVGRPRGDPSAGERDRRRTPRR